MDTYLQLLDNISIVQTIGQTSPVFNIIIKQFKYPEDFLSILVEDSSLVLNIVNFYKQIIDNGLKSSLSLFEIAEQIKMKIIINNNTPIKIKYNRFNDIIYNYLKSFEWFALYYESFLEHDSLPVIDFEINEEYIPSSQIVWRENQLKAIEVRTLNGIQTGIHCQATGTGKSHLIINDIDYIRRNMDPLCKIILFTERVSILKDLFAFNTKYDGANTRLLEWKEKGIGDLTMFNIIDRVTIKKYDWVNLLNNSCGPTLVVINRAFLTSARSKHRNIKLLTAIIFDECHSSTSVQSHNFLKHWKDQAVPIIGYSATPLRSGKTCGELNKDKLLELFHCPDNPSKLNLLTNFNMIYSINAGLILPPKFFWYTIDNYKSRKMGEDVGTDELSCEEIAAFNILNATLPQVINKKVIAWCGTIVLCKRFKMIFEKYKKFYENIKPLELFTDYSGNYSDYIEYKDKPNFAILFCAQKHREGSDIFNLDLEIFLDKVKDRGSIPFIQSIGRVLRIDNNNPDKEHGYVIDGVVKDNLNYDKDFIDKILGYYIALSNMSEDELIGRNKYEQYIKILDIVKFDKVNKTININFGSVTLPINMSRLDWSNIVGKFQTILQQKIKISPEEMFKVYIEKIKLLEPFQNPKNDFWKEYDKLDHSALELPVDIYNDYIDEFDKYTWYDLLGFKNKFLSLEELRLIIYDCVPDIKYFTRKDYLLFKKTIKNLCNYPMEFYRLDNVKTYQDIL